MVPKHIQRILGILGGAGGGGGIGTGFGAGKGVWNFQIIPNNPLVARNIKYFHQNQFSHKHWIIFYDVFHKH